MFDEKGTASMSPKSRLPVGLQTGAIPFIESTGPSLILRLPANVYPVLPNIYPTFTKHLHNINTTFANRTKVLFTLENE